MHRSNANPDSQNLNKSIIYAWNYVEWGGAQVYTMALIREARKFYDILIVLPVDSSAELLRLLDEESIAYEFFEPRTDLDPAPTITRKLKRHWRKIRSEAALIRHLLKKDLSNSVVHIDFTPQQSFLSLLCLCLHTHVFFTLHNALPKFSGLREAIWMAKLRILTRSGHFHMFAANDNAREYLIPFVARGVTDEILVTRAGIDPSSISEVLKEDFNRDKILEKLELPTNQTLLLTVGQFIDRKGRWPYLEAIRAICQKRKDILFLWVLPKLPSAADRARIDQFDVNENFRTILSSNIGTRRTDVLRFFRVADIYVLPSFVEGVPISLLEGMALGIPSISTRINGIPEAIESSKNGLLVDPGDIEGLEKAIVSLVDDPALRKELAARGQAIVLSKFDERAAAEIAVSQYRKFLATVSI